LFPKDNHSAWVKGFGKNAKGSKESKSTTVHVSMCVHRFIDNIVPDEVVHAVYEQNGSFTGD
jgi:hypothetical protein